MFKKIAQILQIWLDVYSERDTYYKWLITASEAEIKMKVKLDLSIRYNNITIGRSDNNTAFCFESMSKNNSTVIFFEYGMNNNIVKPTGRIVIIPISKMQSIEFTKFCLTEQGTSEVIFDQNMFSKN